MATTDHDRARIKALCEARKVRELVHFTRLENLPSIYALGLVPLSGLPHEALRNDLHRLDRQDALCLSVSFPQYQLFYSFRHRPEAQGKHWAVLSLKAEVLWTLDCAFCPINAADRSMRSLVSAPDERGTADAFARLFGDVEDKDGPVARGAVKLPDFLPTSPQAEVLVYEPIPLALVRSVSVDSMEAYQEARQARASYPNAPAPAVRKTYFRPRDDWRFWKDRRPQWDD